MNHRPPHPVDCEPHFDSEIHAAPVHYATIRERTGERVRCFLAACAASLAMWGVLFQVM